jgi:phosphoenolpyruvate---glycerone phosphotransferase subunit DhaL
MSTPEIVTKFDLVNIMRKIRDTMEAQKDYLSKTDTQIGDGDHGFNMSQGFNNVCAKMEVFEKEDIGGFLKKSGLEMIKTIGGAAGAIYGTFFTAQATCYHRQLNGREVLAPKDITEMLAEALDQIKKRGGAKIGDKTMVDALEPAVEELSRGVASGMKLKEMFEKAALKAAEGAENTKTMVAKHGRSKYVGERSLGFVDPGAVSMALIFKAIADYLGNC